MRKFLKRSSSFRCPHLYKEVYIIEKRKTLALLGLLIYCLVIVSIITVTKTDSIYFSKQNSDDVKISLKPSYITVKKVSNSSVIENSEEEILPNITVEQEEKVASERTAGILVSRNKSNDRTIPKVTGSDTVISIIREVAVSAGCTEQETEMLLFIASKESSLRPDAVNLGGQCIGLFQLDSNKGSRAQRIDPYWNTTKAISYMRERYGSISDAYSFRLANNWY